MRILSFIAKCSDSFGMTITDNSKYIAEKDGYVPYDIGIGGGDYIEMKIDIDTGQIIGWNVAKVQKFIEQQEKNER